MTYFSIINNNTLSEIIGMFMISFKSSVFKMASLRQLKVLPGILGDGESLSIISAGAFEHPLTSSCYTSTQGARAASGRLGVDNLFKATFALKVCFYH